MGVTGARASVSSDLPKLVSRIKRHCNLPLAVGFGVSTREHFVQVGHVAEGVVIGSQIIQLITSASSTAERSQAVRKFAQEVTNSNGDRSVKRMPVEDLLHSAQDSVSTTPALLLNRFGQFGGSYAPESLSACLTELEHAFNEAKSDPEFWKEFKSYYTYIGRPSPLHLADRLSEMTGANIWLKREDLNHTGSHKINNALGQILLAKRLGKRRIIAETGAGQHGVATATVCAKFGLECIVYMGAEDVKRQALNVFRMKLMGARVVPVESGSKTLKDAVNEAMREWVATVQDTHYLIGSAIG